eukprot:jgi/Mesvir1/7550/Mv19292-RA.1
MRRNKGRAKKGAAHGAGDGPCPEEAQGHRRGSDGGTRWGIADLIMGKKRARKDPGHGAGKQQPCGHGGRSSGSSGSPCGSSDEAWLGSDSGSSQVMERASGTTLERSSSSSDSLTRAMSLLFSSPGGQAMSVAHTMANPQLQHPLQHPAVPAGSQGAVSAPFDQLAAPPFPPVGDAHLLSSNTNPSRAMVARRPPQGAIQAPAAAAPPLPGALTLQELTNVPGVGALIMSAVPLVERLRLRSLCRSLCSAIDESLQVMDRLSGEDLAPLRPHPYHHHYGAHMPPPAQCWPHGGLHSGPPANGQANGLPFNGQANAWNTNGQCAAYVGQWDLWGAQAHGGAHAMRFWNGAGPGRTSGLHSAALYGDAFLWLVQRCPNLLELHATTPRQPHLHISERNDPAGWWDSPAADHALVRVAASCRHLTSLDVASCGGVTDVGLSAVARGCERLERLDVGLCRYVSDAGIMEVAKHCRGLVHLDVSRAAVTDAGITAVAQHCTRLRHLNVGECVGVTNASIIAIARSCRDLVHLDIGACHFNDAALEAVALCCPRLQTLNAGWCRDMTDVGVALVGTHAGDLRHLELEDCPNVTDDGVSALARPGSLLQHLNLSSCLRVTDVSVLLVASACAGLRVLELTNCEGVTDGGVGAVAAKCRHLQRVDVTGCSGVTDASILQLADTCPQLERLEVSTCPNVTDAGIMAVAAKCTGLRHLDVSGSDAVTDASIRAVADKCVRLRQLRAGEAHNVTVESIRAVARNCRELELLEATGCPGVQLAKPELIGIVPRGCELLC